MPFCPGCGTQTNAAACASCGTAIPSLTQQRSPEPRVPMGAIGVIAVLAVGALWAFGHASATHAFESPSVNSDAEASVANAAASYSHIAEDIETGGTHCTPRDFKVSGLRGTEEYGYITIVGVLKNNCGEAAAPQLKVSIYNKQGTMLDTDETWPASVSNIAAHDSYEFKTMMPAKDGWETYRVGVMTVKRW